MSGRFEWIRRDPPGRFGSVETVRQSAAKPAIAWLGTQAAEMPDTFGGQGPYRWAEPGGESLA
jgi:hypothetical protein